MTPTECAHAKTAAALAIFMTFCLAAPTAHADDILVPLAIPGSYVVATSQAEAENNPVTQKPQLKHIERVAYPQKAKDEFQEGWVLVETTVTAEGRSKDVKVTDSYPKGLFDKIAIAAYEKAEFSPATINGDHRESRGVTFGFTFIMTGQRGISEDNLRKFRTFRDQLSSRQFKEAESTLQQLKNVFEAGKFNLTEFARYNDLAARLSFQKHELVAANERVNRALELGKFLENQNVFESTQKLKFLIDVGFQRYDDAVDYFDAWVQKLEHKPEPEMSALVEKLRAAGYGKHRKIEVLTRAEMIERDQTRQRAWQD